MVLPLAQDTYRPIVKRLEAEGLIARETSSMIKVAPEKEDEAVRYQHHNQQAAEKTGIEALYNFLNVNLVLSFVVHIVVLCVSTWQKKKCFLYRVGYKISGLNEAAEHCICI